MNGGVRYALVFAVPALLVSGIASLLLFGAAAGVLWLFVFGDNEWPRSAQYALGFVFAAAWLLLLVVLVRLAWIVGSRTPVGASMPRRHLLAAAATTLMALIVIVLHQRSVGNLGPRSDGETCAAFCASKGFVGSSMPPRDAGAPTCSCLDGQGHPAVTVPLGEAGALKN